MMSQLLRLGNLDPSEEVIGNQLKETVFRSEIIFVGWVGAACYVAVNMVQIWLDLPQISLALIALVAGSLFALRLSDRNLQAGQAVWLSGIGLCLLLLQFFFPHSNIFWLFGFLPMLALVVSFRLSWAVAGFIFLGLSGVFLGPSGGPYEVLQVLMLGLVSTGVVWFMSSALVSTAAQALENYRKMRMELEDTRKQRVELLEVQENYRLANKELARLNGRLALMTQYAEEAKHIKEDFVARVSHELRTPLNMVIGFSEVIMRSPQIYGDGIPTALLADIDAIQRNSQHLARLVDDILDLSQVEAGKMALTKEWVQIENVIDEAAAVVRGLVEAKHLYMHKDIEEGLPLVLCDSTRIRQVIINLLGNASRFTDQGGIEVQARLKEDGVWISVRDTGPGIPEADQKRIFQPFQQINTSLRKHKGGTGLGLTISKQFVEMHGGKMWLESIYGEGTTFTFMLPLRAAVDADFEADLEAHRWINPYNVYEPRTQTSGLPDLTGSPRYILVEPEDTLHRLFVRYMDNVELISVRTIDDALVEVFKKPVQGLVLNIPSLQDEPQLVEKIGHLPFGTPVLTCWVPGKEEAAHELGVVEYLIKPIQHTDLMRVVERVSPDVKKILLVDDEPEILRLFIRMLSSSGRTYQIIQASNGVRALQLMRSRKPDMVILDLVMPEMDGFQVLHEKSHDERIRDIPVVVVSSLNPRGETMVSRNLSVSRGDGLSINELLLCIQELTKILVPTERKLDPVLE
jgi:signal transduction histidine kinase/CheY-like chemotaxis protein